MTDTSASEILATEQEETFPYKLIGINGTDLLADLGKPEEKRVRIQALLAQWMRMENIVTLIAAGCSCGEKIGGKALSPLEDSVLGFLVKKYEGEKENAALKSIIESRATQKKTNNELNFEQWLSYLSNLEYVLSSKNTPISDAKWKAGEQSVSLTANQLKTLLLDLERVIYAFCSLTLPSIIANTAPLGHHAFFAKLVARDSALGRAHVFTLNYDTVIEQALDHLGIHYFDGFCGKTESRFDPSNYGLDVYYPGDVTEGRVRRFDKFLHLYKLHGSIHWQINDSDVLTARHESLSGFEKWRQMEQAAQIKEFNALWKNGEKRIGILPTSNKFVQTLELPYAHLFRAFHQRLHTPQTFFIVAGYGFGDGHVNQIIDAALTNPSLVMLVVDPNPSHALLDKFRRYQSIGERIFFLCPDTAQTSPFKIATFDDFATALMPQVQWLDDFIKLRKYERTVTQAGKDPSIET